jgi:hypothetical protein
MTDSRQLPPARERYKSGMRSLDWDVAPNADEAFIDRVRISVSGSVQYLTEDGDDRYRALLNGGPSGSFLHADYRIFGTGHSVRPGFRMKVMKGSSILWGELKLSPLFGRDGCRLQLDLQLNPTRTLSHLLGRYSIEDIESLDAAAFFALDPAPVATAISLDANDNMVADFAAFSGTFFHTRTSYIRRFLAAYERALKDALIEHLCPVQQGFIVGDDCDDIVARSDFCSVQVGWSELSVGQCEVYWERQTTSALDVVRHLADGALAAARSCEVTAHPMAGDVTMERELDALSVRWPLTPRRNLTLAIYAKSRDRVRLEVRYHEKIPSEVRDGIRRERGRMFEWLESLRRDASGRIQFEGLRRLLEPAAPPSVTALCDFIEALDAACNQVADTRRRVLELLLTTGGISVPPSGAEVPPGVVDHLRRAGVVERVRLVGRELRGSRRYRLTEKFRGLRLPPAVD